MAKSALKWAGNKGFIATALERLMHHEFDDLDNLRVMEPFIGSGGFSLHYEFKNVIANDLNPPLIHYYETIKSSGIELFETENDEEIYYRHRDYFNEKVFAEEYDNELASIFLYLNRCCYNGLMRTNLKGGMNTPRGDIKKFPLWTIERANESSSIISNWQLSNGCFTELDVSKEIDLVYLDPPYAGKKMFTSYTGQKFTYQMQEKVIEFAERFPKSTRIMISNSVFDKKLLKAYKEAGYTLYTIKVPRTISSKVTERNAVDEVIAFKNFQTKRIKSLCEKLNYLKI